MEQYFILFYQDGKAEIDKKGYSFKEGESMKVTRTEMFRWLQHSHHNNIKIEIYEARVVCDLS